MLIPANIVKIISFKDDHGNKFSIPTESANTMQVQLDNGNVIDVKITSMNKDFSTSLKDFLYFKATGLMKDSEVKKGAYDLVMGESEVYSEMLENTKQQLKTQNSKLTEKQLTQQAAEMVARNIIFNKTLIKQASTIRIPLAISENNASYNAKAISVEKNKEGENVFGRSGIYYFSQLSNHIPIEITPIKNKEGNFVGYFKIMVSNLINAVQINSLIDHTLRTMREMFKQNTKPYLLQFQRVENTPQELLQYMTVVNGIEKINREGKISKEDFTRYAESLKSIKEYIKVNNAYRYFKVNIPILLDEKFMQKALSEVNKEQGKSPLQSLQQSIVNLNFGKENPDVKQKISAYIESYLSNFSNGVTDFKILTVLSFPASDIFDNSNSWGFLSNNISGAKMTLSFQDTYNLINQLQVLVNEI